MARIREPSVVERMGLALDILCYRGVRCRWFVGLSKRLLSVGSFSVVCRDRGHFCCFLSQLGVYIVARIGRLCSLLFLREMSKEWSLRLLVLDSYLSFLVFTYLLWLLLASYGKWLICRMELSCCPSNFAPLSFLVSFCLQGNNWSLFGGTVPCLLVLSMLGIFLFCFGSDVNAMFFFQVGIGNILR